MKEIKTLIVDNFSGNMTQYFTGDINSGKSYLQDVFGYDPFSKPGLLTWNDQETQIDAAGSVITDLILDGKARNESGIDYVYCVGHTGRLYKIQVNDVATKNPDYDTPVLLATLTAGTPTFTRGAFMDFFGSTERIYISHDKGVTRINFDGTSETAIGLLASWTQNVPKPMQQLLGNLVIGHGNNIALIDSTATVTNYTRLSPAFPSNTQIRDMKVTPDGNYLQMIVTEHTLPDITSTTPDTSLLAPSDSFLFKWNGVDDGYTSYTSYPSIILSALALFGDQQYLFGYDFFGGALFIPSSKLLTSLPRSGYCEPSLPNAVVPIGNAITWFAPLLYTDHLEMIYLTYGTISPGEINPGYWSNYDRIATGGETDVLRCPFQMIVSNFSNASSSSGYTNYITGKNKIYFSTLETSAAPTTKYKFFKWSFLPTSNGTSINLALFQTQTQSFSKKISVKEVRIYGEPWVANNGFKIEFVGPSQTAIINSDKTFTAGTNLTVGDDFAWYNPSFAPTASLGLRIWNTGTVNHTIVRVEIDYVEAGN